MLTILTENGLKGIKDPIVTQQMKEMQEQITELQNIIANKLDISKISNGSTITQEGYAADARQLNPSINGSIAQKTTENTNKIAELNEKFKNYYTLSGGTEIKAYEDLNNMKYFVPGNYYCPANVTAQTLKNCPSIDAFTLKVEHSTGDSYPSQTLRAFFGGEIYYRFFDGNAIHEWKLLDPQ